MEKQPGHWDRARALFAECVDLAGPGRARVLEARCGDDATLRAAVESLLRAHDALPHTADDPLARGIAEEVDKWLPEARPGQRFGAFRIIDEIGRGGMGVVYLAERDDGTVTQRVALKIVARAQLGPDAAGRLARERRLLATLEHPNIARLIDAGTGPGGVPYFAMEYVQGLPITTYCDRKSLPLAERLRLFHQVCSAVQHAHAQLVVHRDLKAGNILIREDGMPKLLDFGIAMSLDAERTLSRDAGEGATRIEFLSPGSAPPEQFLGQDFGIATDVYALGVLLCELTAGSRPLDVRGMPFEEAAQRILKVVPRLPSRAADTAAARARGLRGLAALQRRLRGDLDAIAGKALAKAPGDRYASVELLDADIARHLARQPVSVRSGDRRYRLGRFLSRNAMPVVFAVMLSALATGFVLTIVQKNADLARERDQAQVRERQALFEQARAQQVTAFLVGLFRASTPEQTRGHNISARDLLERGRRDLEAGLREQPELRAELLAALSDAYLALDDLDGAEQMAQEASTLRAPMPASHRTKSLVQLADLASRRGKHAQALALVEEARALPVARDRRASADLLKARANALDGLGRPEDAVAVWRQALALEAAEYGKEDVRALRTAIRLAISLHSLGRVDESERLLADSLPLQRKRFAPDDPALGDTLLGLAIAARNRSDFAAAEPLADEGLDIYLKVYGRDSSQAAGAMNTLATIAQANGRGTKARALLEQALATRRAVFGEASMQVATSEYNLGLLLQLHDLDAAQAVVHLRKAVEIGTPLFPPTHGALAHYRLALGSQLRQLGRYTEADTVLGQALATFEASNAPRGVNVALTRGELACSALERTQGRASSQALDEALAVLDRNAPDSQQGARLRSCRAQY